MKYDVTIVFKAESNPQEKVRALEKDLGLSESFIHVRNIEGHAIDVFDYKLNRGEVLRVIDKFYEIGDVAFVEVHKR
ncbi:hypothetical protein J4422_00810 [Candidatus Pacearchaeota archaeon]|nr:hypothetical protein [Candidatus Pacearchaeota archaeon]